MASFAKSLQVTKSPLTMTLIESLNSVSKSQFRRFVRVKPNLEEYTMRGTRKAPMTDKQQERRKNKPCSNYPFTLIQRHGYTVPMGMRTKSRLNTKTWQIIQETHSLTDLRTDLDSITLRFVRENGSDMQSPNERIHETHFRAGKIVALPCSSAATTNPHHSFLGRQISTKALFLILGTRFQPIFSFGNAYCFLTLSGKCFLHYLLDKCRWTKKKDMRLNFRKSTNKTTTLRRRILI